MTDQNNSSNRLVTNQLFNASVIGATIEDYSRNALLFPVQDLNVTTNTDQSDSKIPGVNSALQQSHTVPTSNNTSAPFPSTLDFSTTLPPNKTLLGTSLAGQPNNLYRRSTAKKITYAQIPGLVSNHQQPNEYTNITHPLSSLQPSQNINQSPSLITHYESTLKPLEHFKTSSNILVPDSSSASLDELNSHSPSPALGALLIPTLSTDLSVQYDQLESLSSFSNSSNLQFNNTGIPYNQSSMTMTTQIYRPVYHHWFYKHSVSGEHLWTPFSMPDSLALEEAFTSSDLSPDTVVATDGNRYDVNILRRERYAIYWEAPPCEVRRCSWFNKTNVESKCIPYEENIATILEEEYKKSVELNEWNRFVTLPNSETILFQGPDMLARLPPNPVEDYWASPSTSTSPQAVLKRGMDEFDIHEGEPAEVDHLLFVVHGIGEFCDLKLRSVQEVVDEFRSLALKMMISHFHSSNTCNRVEILPISWHQSLHSQETGIDQLLKNITLESLPLLRDFTNNTLLDILFYTTPIYSQAVITSVSSDLNRIFNLFQSRNPSFKGGVSLIGHSLGSLILFDILSHQVSHCKEERLDSGTVPQEVDSVLDEDDDILTDLKPVEKRLLIRRISNLLLEAGAQPAKIMYPHLNFTPSALYALGSPIGVFMAVRGLDNFGADFALPNCKSFFNIFHPYDPVAYRIEPLVNLELNKVKPSVMPHHTGRKRIHLELRETLQKFQGNIKERVIGSVVNAFRRLYPGNETTTVDSKAEECLETSEPNIPPASSVNYGILNNGHRIDYVLQESPFEFINDYIFALRSHVCYWSSEDTVLFILTQIYGSMDTSLADLPKE